MVKFWVKDLPLSKKKGWKNWPHSRTDWVAHFLSRVIGPSPHGSPHPPRLQDCTYFAVNLAEQAMQNICTCSSAQWHVQVQVCSSWMQNWRDRHRSYPMGHLIFGTPMQLQLSDPPSDGQHANQTRSCGLSRAAQLVLKRTCYEDKVE